MSVNPHDFPKNHILRTHIDNELHATLAIGDPPDKVEQEFRREKFEFSFDPLADRYQAIFRPKEMRIMERAVQIYIYVDKDKRLSKIEVRNVYTFL